MKISRRNLLLQAGIMFPATAVVPSLSLAETPFKSFHLILSDISPQTDPDSLLAVLEPFVKALVPVSCIVTLEDDAEKLRPDSGLARYLRRFIADYAAQIEVVIKTPPLTDQPYYFQSRLATQARRALDDALLTVPTENQLARSVLTVAKFGGPIAFEPEGVRAAGFRTVLSLPPSGIDPVDSRWIGGVLHLFGGMSFGLTEQFGVIENALKTSVLNDPRALLILSMAGLTPDNTDAAVARMTQIATLISELARAGQIVPTTPTEYHLRASSDPATLIGLRLDVHGTPDEETSAGAVELAQWLRAHDFTFTIAGNDAALWTELGTSICPQEGQTSVAHNSHCRMFGPDPDQPATHAIPPRIAMVTPPDMDLIAGVDRHATFHPPRNAFIDPQKTAAQAAAGFKALEDTVLVLDQDAYSSAAQRQKTTTIIAMLNRRLGFKLGDVMSFGEQIQPEDSIRRVFHQTEEVMDREKPGFDAPEQLDHDALRQDAELAWRYFQNLQNPQTGLISSTAFIIEGDITAYDYATMWDVGSQVLGMIAAVTLGLMTSPELAIWASRLIEALPSVTIQGLKLPSAIIQVGNKEAPDQSFNSCDVGRLLIAFDRLRAFSPTLKDHIEHKVAGWDLQKTIRDGRMQNVTARRFSDQFVSHCTNYAARGYAAFGMTANAPYTSLDAQNDADAKIALLFSASTIGSLGAEPLLLEGIELGFLPNSQYLADMLFAAQLEDYRVTGTMRCVSESALDIAPWFTYQGYSINNFADPWRVQVISNDAAYAGPEFLRAIEVVSVKGAYLFAATHPHSYSNALVNYVRARARIETLGHSSGIYRATGLAMADYSDLNTNGIILEAAAHILK